jgi:hypothetical protein
MSTNNQFYMYRDDSFRRSRVSSKIISGEELNEILNFAETSIKGFKQIITVNIILNSENEKSFLKTIKINVTDSDSVEKVIKLSINSFNHLFERERLNFRFKEKANLFNLKPSKKNGQPKDLPGIFFINLVIDFGIKLLDTKIDNFSLIYNPIALINLKKCKLCNECVIY